MKKKKRLIGRSAKTGKFIKLQEAKKKKATSVVEEVYE